MVAPHKWRASMRSNLMTILEWLRFRNDTGFCHFDGHGYFMGSGERLNGDLFGEIPPGATHVLWINRWANAHPTSNPPVKLPSE
jgi:hypothetical protein